MRISELAERSGTASRLLRYYEEQGLLSPRRLENGYRDYDDDAVERVAKIRGLLEAGVPTRLIKVMLPCLKRPDSLEIEVVDDATVAALRAERDRMDRRIGCLSRNRDAIEDYLGQLECQRVRDAGG